MASCAIATASSYVAGWVTQPQQGRHIHIVAALLGRLDAHGVGQDLHGGSLRRRREQFAVCDAVRAIMSSASRQSLAIWSGETSSGGPDAIPIQQ